MASNNRYTIIDGSGLGKRKVACLTLDVEQDYGDLLDEPSYEGLEHIPEVVNFFRKRGIPLTCFVQGSLLDTHPAQIEPLATLDVEFELHSYSHPSPKKMCAQSELKQGKEAYRRFFGREPLGYRFPLGAIGEEDYGIFAANGFKFDSSVFPSWRPGIFNNLRMPTRPFRVVSCEIIEFPFTVFSSVIRIPVALSYIKLLGEPYLRLLKTFSLPSLIVFDFHLHDLFPLSSSDKLPLHRFSFPYRLIFRRIYQRHREGLVILDDFISILQGKGYSFWKLIDVYEALSR